MTFQQQAKEAIRTGGGRVTPQRELLLDLLATLDHDVDAEYLYRLASTHDPNLSLPTVYRTLHTLEAAQVITSHYVSSDHERRLYRISDTAEVFHFTCRRCGRVSRLQTGLIEQLRTELRTQLGAEVSGLCLCASGLCAACQEEDE